MSADEVVETALHQLSWAAVDSEGRELALQDVVATMSRLLTADAHQHRALSLRALAYYGLGDLERARADLRASIARGQDESAAAFVLGPEGVSYLEGLLARPRLSAFRKNTLRVHLASLMLDLGQNSDALRALQSVDLGRAAHRRTFGTLVEHLRARAMSATGAV